MTVIDSLVVALGINPDGVKKGMKDAEGAINSGMSRVTNVLQSFAAPLAGMFTAGKLFQEYISGADAVKKLSDSLGVNMEDMQAWGEAAARAGGSVQGFQQSLSSFNTQVQQFAAFGSGRGAQIFDSLGISVKDAGGNVRDSLDIMGDLADKAQSMSAAEFTGLAKRLGLDQGTIALLRQGRDALDETISRQKAFGVYTKQDGETAAAFNDALQNLWQRLKAGSGSIFQTIVPALTAVVNWIGKVIDTLRENESAVKIFFTVFGAAVTAYALPALAKLAVNPFTLMIAGLVALTLALEDFFTWMQGGESAFGGFWSNFGTPDEVREKVNALWETLKGLIPTMSTLVKWGGTLFGSLMAVSAVTRTYRGVSSAVSGISNALKTAQSMAKAAGPVLSIVSSGLGSLGQAAISAGSFIMSTVVPAAWAFTSALLANPITWVVAGIAALIGSLYLLWKHWDTVKEAVLSFWDTCKSLFNSFGDLAATAWNAITGVFSGAVDWFNGIFESVANTIRSIFGTLGGIALDAWNSVTGVFSGAVDWFANIFSQIADGIKGMFGGIVDTITAPLDKGWKKVKGFFGFGGDENPSEGAAGISSGIGLAPLTGEASQSIAPSTVSNTAQSINSETSVSIGKVDVVTQATDAEGISRDIGKGLDKNMTQFAVNQANAGVVQ